MNEKTKNSKPASDIRPVDAVYPDPDLIREAASIIRGGGVVVFPTTGLYGLGADALNPEAVDRVFDIKQRPSNNPILVLIEDRRDLISLVRDVPPAAIKLMDRFWPGAVTIIFDAVDTLPANLTAGTGKIGIRVPRHPVASALVKAVKAPVTGTSANLSGQPGCSDISQLDPLVVIGADLVLDAGILEGGKGSTVVDVTGPSLRILREGAVSGKHIFALFD